MGKIATVSEIIDALGGTMATARLIPASAAAVSNWRRNNKLPAHTFFIINKKLKDISYNAPSSLLWGIPEPEDIAS